MSDERRRPEDTDLYMKYLGCLGLMAESAVYLTRSEDAKDVRDCIIDALNDACANYPLRTRQILDRIEIEPDSSDE